jgi:colanic acid/amylovoran biosynthesis glycosyltransferase
MMDSKKRNLLILTSSFPRNSSDSTCGYIRDFARSQAAEFNVQVLAPPDSRARSWPPDVFTLSRSTSLLGIWEPFQGSRDLNDLSTRSLLIKAGLLFSVLVFWVEALRLARRADVICSHWLMPSGLIGSAAARLLRKPHVIVEHSGALHLLARVRGGQGLARFIIRSTRAIVVVSADLRNRLIGLCPEAREKVEVMQMGIATQRGAIKREIRRAERSGLKRTILFVGRLVEIKGLEILLRASKGCQVWRLLIAGDGELGGKMRRLAAALGVEAHFLGQVDADTRSRLFRLADVVVIPSVILDNGRTEGTPVVCLEALAAGCPVICSRVGGLAEIIVDGENGLLVEPGDPELLRDKLTIALGDRRLLHKLSVNGRRTAESLDWSRVGSRLGDIIKGSISQND